jgi:hypothetical protein
MESFIKSYEASPGVTTCIRAYRERVPALVNQKLKTSSFTTRSSSNPTSNRPSFAQQWDMAMRTTYHPFGTGGSSHKQYEDVLAGTARLRHCCSRKQRYASSSRCCCRQEGETDVLLALRAQHLSCLSRFPCLQSRCIHEGLYGFNTDRCFFMHHCRQCQESDQS